MKAITESDPATVVAGLRAAFASGRTRPVAWRREQLGALRALLTERSEDFLTALHADLGKGPAEAYRTEIAFTLNELDHTVRHLDEWLSPQ